MEGVPLTQRSLQAMKQQARYKTTSHLRSPQAISRRPYSHFPGRRKCCATKPAPSSTRPFSTSRRLLLLPQDPLPSEPQQHQTSPSAFSPSATTPSTAPKPSIIGELVKKLRTGSSTDSIVPADKRPLSEQLNIFDDIMDVMGSDPKRRPPPPSSSSFTNNPSRSADDEGFDQAALYRNLVGAAYRQSDEPKVSLRLKPALGRTQPLDLMRNVDLTAAFRKVERKCTDNSVKVDARNQRTYVRRGQRRKDERRRRWRALFKEGFLHECARIRKMKAQGW